MNGSTIEGTLYPRSGIKQSFIINNLKNPPPQLKSVTNNNERDFIIRILCKLHSFTKSSTHLAHGLEDCTTFYKVFSSNFRERLTLNDLKQLEDINYEIKWLAIRDVYIEMDTRRVVVELNKESSRRFQPPLEPRTNFLQSSQVDTEEKFIMSGKRMKPSSHINTGIIAPPDMFNHQNHPNRKKSGQSIGGILLKKITDVLNDEGQEDDDSSADLEKTNSVNGSEEKNEHSPTTVRYENVHFMPIHGYDDDSN